MILKNQPCLKIEDELFSPKSNETIDESHSMEDLKVIFSELGINYPLPADQDFLGTENIFENFPVEFNSIATYELSKELSLTIGINILTKPLNLSNGFISLEDADKLGIHLCRNQWKQFGIENIHFVKVDLKIYVFIESTLFPHWRWKSLMNPKWRNGCRIVNPLEKSSIIWLCSEIIY